MRMLSASTLALAITLGLGSTAIANDGRKDHAANDAHDAKAMHDKASHGEMHGNTHAGHAKGAEGDRLHADFRRLDADDDGRILIREAGLDPTKRNNVAIFDADDDGFLDRYEYEMAHVARFETLDGDGDGKLSRAEIAPVKPEWVTWAAIDSNNNRGIDAEEYRRFVESDDWVVDRDRYAFDYMDRDRSGGIDNLEASRFVPLASTFTAYDPDGDGTIERTQYELFLTEVDTRQQQGNRVAGSGQQ